MDSVDSLYRSVRGKFSALSATADLFHAKRWGEYLEAGFEYAWFESLADALNHEMRSETPYQTHRALFEYIAGVYGVSPAVVQQCIDVSFVENLFWQVPSGKCALYWAQIPPAIKQLYFDFHRREP